MKYIYLFYFLSLHILSNAQNLEPILNKEHSIEDLKYDFQLLREQFEKVQPGLYTYTSKDSMDLAFDQIMESLNEPMSAIEFYRKITPLHNYIRSSHTNFKPAKDYVDAVKHKMLRFPFSVYWHDNALYILENNSSVDNIQEGSQINSINGEAADIVFRQLTNNMIRDGYNSTGPELLVNKYFSLYYAYFIGAPDSFQMEITRPAGTLESINIPAITADDVAKNRLKRYKVADKSRNERKEPLLLFDIRDGIAFMTIKIFQNAHIKNSKQHFKKFLDESFESMKEANVEHLVLDLRDNGGGDDKNIAELFSRVYSEPFTLYRKMTAKTKKVQDEEFYVEKSLYNLFLPFMFTKTNDGYKVNRLGNSGMLRPYKSAKSIYNGKIYLLINGNSYSATGIIAGLFKNYQRAIIIGEEAGGNPNQCTAGMFKTLRLPNTGIEASIWLAHIQVNVEFKNTGHGVIPDYPIQPSIADLIEEKDRVMDFALKLINEEKKDIIE